MIGCFGILLIIMNDRFLKSDINAYLYGMNMQQ